jgi:hypothetical protein
MISFYEYSILAYFLPNATECVQYINSYPLIPVLWNIDFMLSTLIVFFLCPFVKLSTAF